MNCDVMRKTKIRLLCSLWKVYNLSRIAATVPDGWNLCIVMAGVAAAARPTVVIIGKMSISMEPEILSFSRPVSVIHPILHLPLTNLCPEQTSNKSDITKIISIMHRCHHSMMHKCECGCSSQKVLYLLIFHFTCSHKIDRFTTFEFYPFS